MRRRFSFNSSWSGSAGASPSTSSCLRVVLRLVLLIAFTAPPTLAKEPSLTIRKSPFSSSSYRLWKGAKRDPTPRSVERTIRRNPPVGPHSEKLEDQGSHFTSDRKAPYVKPSKR